jgi:REP element-mobilizing transposase RayT
MARPLRFVYPGAVYHTMARGDGGKAIFLEKDDHLLFLSGLGRVCASHGWRVHAWVLMGNHFHLLLETPEPNLVSGMRILLGSFAQTWNRRYQRRGHVFQGRYKSIPVTGERASDPLQFRVVADYIHLNPARANLAGGVHGKLVDYEWSSLPAYQRGKGPAWLVHDRVLDAFDLAKDGRGWRSYVEYLEKRALNDGGNTSDAAMTALRKGWYLGDATFRDWLLEKVAKSSKQLTKMGSHAPAPVKRHGEVEAEKIIVMGLAELALVNPSGQTTPSRKGDPRKVALASVVKAHTSVCNEWLAARLEMGHNRSVSRLIRQGAADANIQKICANLMKMLPCED